MNDSGGDLPQPFSDGSGSGSGSGFNWSSMFGGSGGGGGGGFGGPNISDLFGLYAAMNSDNPADSAMSYYNQIPDMLKGIYSPYMQAGNAAVQPFLSNISAVNPYLQGGNWAAGNLQNQTNSLVNNPTGVMNAIGSTFKQSPGYNWQTQQAQQAVNNAAAAGGMAGSPLQQQNSANVVNQLANQDYYNYLNHGMEMYNQGYQGLQGMYGTGANIANNMYGIAGNIANNMYGAGANAANQYAENLGSTLMNQGNLAYNGTINDNQKLGAEMGYLGDFTNSVFNPGGSAMSSMGGGGGSGQGGGGGGGSSGSGGSSLMSLLPLLAMFL
jgi:hypothetical protein